MKKYKNIMLLIAALLIISMPMSKVAWGDNSTTETYIEMADNPGFDNPVMVKDWNTDTNFNATGLEPGRTYYFRAKSRNSDGIETDWSSQVSKTTIRAIIYSSNSNHVYANVGDIVTLEFTASEKLKELPIVVIARQVADVVIVNEENKEYKATYTLNDNDEIGTITFSIEMIDLEGNISTITSTTDGSKVFFCNENAYQDIEIVQDAIDLLENLPEAATQEKRDEIAENIVDKVITLPDLTVDDIIDVIEAIPREPATNAVSDDKANELIEKLIEKAIEVAKDNDDLDKIKDVIDNSTLPDSIKDRLNEEVTDRENLNNVVIDDSKSPPVIKLDPLSKGREYRIEIKDIETQEVVRTINTPRGTLIEVPELIEGKAYKVKIDIVRIADEVVIVTRTFTITIKDITAPEITGIYILNGQLTVLAKDNVKLHDNAYAFRIIQEGEDITEIESSIRDNTFNSMVFTQENGGMTTINYQSQNNTGIKPIKSVIVIVRDATGNGTLKTVKVIKENETLYGEVPQNIKDQIYYKNNPPKPERDIDDKPEKESEAPKSDVVIIPPVSDELKGVIEGTLKDSNLTVGVVETEPNSQKGEISIDIKKDLDQLNELVKTELKNDNNVYYRINVTEKSTNRLVYTKLLTSADNIIIPDLQDSTTYLIQIFLVQDGKELAFRTIEKMTYDKTPPTIEQVLVRGSTLEVLAHDNHKLHEKAYQYLVNNVLRLSFNERLDVLLADNNSDETLSNMDWSSSMWTEANKLNKLDTGVKVRVIVRDASNNYTIADVIVKDGVTYNTINADNPMPIQLNDQMPVDDLIEKVISEYNAKNPQNQIKYNGDPNNYEVQTSNPIIATIENGRLIAKSTGRVTITITDKETGATYRYSIIVTKYAIFDRRIVVQTKSQTELLKAFEKPLYNEFLGRTIAFYLQDTTVGKVEGTVFVAEENEGIATIVATDGQRQLLLYIVIAKDNYPESNVELIISNVAYVLKVGDRINIKDVSAFYDELVNETNTDYLVTELDGNALRIDGKYIEAVKEGKGSVNIIDLANSRIEQIDLIVTDFIEITTTNNTKHWAKAEFDTLSKKGILTDGYKDIDLNDNASIKDFLIMLSRTKTYCRNNPATGRISLPINMKKNEAYYYVMDALNNMNMFEVEAILGEDLDLNATITREQAAAILALTLKLDSSTNTKSTFKDIDVSNYKEQINAVYEAGLMVGVGNNAFAANKDLSIGELCKIVCNIDINKEVVLGNINLLN